MENKTGNLRPRVLSGMRPTGKLHLGNYVGALQNWVKLQHSHECFFFIADWHALTTDYDDTSLVGNNSLEVLLDWLGAGLDPEKCTMFVQSHVRQHAELHLLFSMITPLSWLERVPSYKDQQENLQGKDLLTYGFLGYPLLQAADIVIYRADYVPVGEDQVAHVELTREVARRFNHFFSRSKSVPLLREPQVLLTATPKLLGTDKRKMSKSYGNSILLSDEAAQVEEKIRNSVTDRPKLTDHGSPDRCPVGNLHQIFSDRERLVYITEGCTQATITCVECKVLATQSTDAHLGEIRELRRQKAQNPGLLKEIIEHGTTNAAKVAEETMVAVREAIGLLNVAEVAGLVRKQSDAHLLRTPASIADAKTDEERWDLRVATWIEAIGGTSPLRKDRREVYITRKGRKVGVHAAGESPRGWEFRFEDRKVNVLALITEDKDRCLRAYVLPPTFLEEYSKQFPRNDERVEILVGKDAEGNVALNLKGDVPVSIQQYEGDYSALQ